MSVRSISELSSVGTMSPARSGQRIRLIRQRTHHWSDIGRIPLSLWRLRWLPLFRIWLLHAAQLPEERVHLISGSPACRDDRKGNAAESDQADRLDLVKCGARIGQDENSEKGHEKRHKGWDDYHFAGSISKFLHGVGRYNAVEARTIRLGRPRQLSPWRGHFIYHQCSGSEISSLSSVKSFCFLADPSTAAPRSNLA